MGCYVLCYIAKWLEVHSLRTNVKLLYLGPLAPARPKILPFQAHTTSAEHLLCITKYQELHFMRPCYVLCELTVKIVQYMPQTFRYSPKTVTSIFLQYSIILPSLSCITITISHHGKAPLIDNHPKTELLHHSEAPSWCAHQSFNEMIWLTQVLFQLWYLQPRQLQIMFTRAVTVPSPWIIVDTSVHLSMATAAQ